MDQLKYLLLFTFIATRLFSLSQCNIELDGEWIVIDDPIDLYDIKDNDELLLSQLFSNKQVDAIYDYVKTFSPLLSVEELRSIPSLQNIMLDFDCIFYIGNRSNNHVFRSKIYNSYRLDSNWYNRGVATWNNFEVNWTKKEQWNYSLNYTDRKFQLHLGCLKYRFGQGLLWNNYGSYTNLFAPHLIRRYRPIIGLISTDLDAKYNSVCIIVNNLSVLKINTLYSLTKVLIDSMFVNGIPNTFGQYYQLDLGKTGLDLGWKYDAENQFGTTLEIDHLYNEDIRIYTSFLARKGLANLTGLELRWSDELKSFHHFAWTKDGVLNTEITPFNSTYGQQLIYNALQLDLWSFQVNLYQQNQSRKFSIHDDNSLNSKVGCLIQRRWAYIQLLYRSTWSYTDDVSKRRKLLILLRINEKVNFSSIIYLNKYLYDYQAYFKNRISYSNGSFRMMLEIVDNGTEELNFGGPNLFAAVPGQYEYNSFGVNDRIFRLRISNQWNNYKFYVASSYNLKTYRVFMGLRYDLILARKRSL